MLIFFGTCAARLGAAAAACRCVVGVCGRVCGYRVIVSQVQEYDRVGYVPLTSTTTPDVPNLFRQALRLRADIDEQATDYLPAEKATRELEREVCVGGGKGM